MSLPGVIAIKISFRSNKKKTPEAKALLPSSNSRYIEFMKQLARGTRLLIGEDAANRRRVLTCLHRSR